MIIGINGFKNVGKDTAGDYICSKYDFEKASFADKLKESVASLFGVDKEIFETWKNDPNARVALFRTLDKYDLVPDDNELIVNVSVREFLQRYGTESHRDVFGFDFWVKTAFKDIDEFGDYVFTDARFENELQAIHDVDGFNIRIVRESVDAKDSHASEVEPPLRLIDYIIYNNSDISELYAQIDSIMDEIYSFNVYGDWRDKYTNYGE